MTVDDKAHQFPSLPSSTSLAKTFLVEPFR
jgi:hypothetical protein